MSVFYAYSNNRDETRNTYDKICEKIDDIIIDVDNNDPLNSHQILDKIKSSTIAQDLKDKWLEAGRRADSNYAKWVEKFSKLDFSIRTSGSINNVYSV
jgi:hypothetical protein